MPPNAVESYLSLLRVFIGQHIRMLTGDKVPARGAAPILIMLDELPRLKDLPPVDKALNIGRKYGLRLWMFAQSVGPLRNAYKNADGMLADAHVNPKDVERENALLDEIRRVDLDPALGQTLSALDEKYEQKKQALDDKIAALQPKFDERHADKGADEKQGRQGKLDKQFEDLRAPLEKAQEQAEAPARAGGPGPWAGRSRERGPRRARRQLRALIRCGEPAPTRRIAPARSRRPKPCRVPPCCLP